MSPLSPEPAERSANGSLPSCSASSLLSTVVSVGSSWLTKSGPTFQSQSFQVKWPFRRHRLDSRLVSPTVTPRYSCSRSPLVRNLPPVKLRPSRRFHTGTFDAVLPSGRVQGLPQATSSCTQSERTTSRTLPFSSKIS